MASLVTLLTDFGNVDSYVAEVKAVLLSGLPDVRIVDISHEVPPFQIRHGAFQLLRAYRHFPPGTCHVGVVDPGVGTERKALYARSSRYHFIGPDNGLLRWALEDCEAREGSPVEVFELSTPSGIDPTFHGRDVFAPCAVRVLKSGLTPHLPKVSKLTGTSFPYARETPRGLKAEVVVADRFGNLVLSASHVGDGARTTVWKRRTIHSFANYASLPPKGAGLIRGSHGYWEIACRNASAEKRLRAALGEPVLLKRTPAPKTKREG